MLTTIGCCLLVSQNSCLHLKAARQAGACVKGPQPGSFSGSPSLKMSTMRRTLLLALLCAAAQPAQSQQPPLSFVRGDFIGTTFTSLAPCSNSLTCSPSQCVTVRQQQCLSGGQSTGPDHQQGTPRGRRVALVATRRRPWRLRWPMAMAHGDCERAAHGPSREHSLFLGSSRPFPLLLPSP